MNKHNLPLAGLKILDLSRILAGPWCTQLFGDLGAEVIKIESPEGDGTRQWGPPFFDGKSAYYLSTNRNKKSRVLDFKNPGDLVTLRGLVRSADVLIENFRTGTLTKFGLDGEAALELNPQLIYCSFHGFEQNSDWGTKPGFDALIQAMSGLMSITGTANGEPVKVGVAISDILAGLYASNGILAALLERQRSGQGQLIEIPLFDTQVACLANVVSNFLTSREVPKALGSAHPNIVPYQCFSTLTQPVMVAVGTDKQFASLCQVMATDWHEQDDYRTNPRRVENRHRLVPLIQELMLTRARDDWLEIFAIGDFPYGPVNDLGDLFDHPYARESGLFVTLDDALTPGVRNPIRFSRTPLDRYESPPELDEHPDAKFD
ncbi:MAG: CoA transferase [Candidatus Thiodiazotropha sp. (ex Ustalcina ferruginea)]|nr:CoA transferase [Candidatus Thiodiazotropha sp. (ex Ustalcina ferruginea)]